MGKAAMEQAATELVEVQAMMHTKTHQKNKNSRITILRKTGRQSNVINQSIKVFYSDLSNLNHCEVH